MNVQLAEDELFFCFFVMLWLPPLLLLSENNIDDVEICDGIGNYYSFYKIPTKNLQHKNVC